MQSIGVVGETILMLALPSGHAMLEGSILRFVIFDSLGVLALLLSVWVTHSHARLAGGEPGLGEMRG